MLPDHRPFLDELFAALDQHGIYVSSYPLDHLCYRVASTARYMALKKELLQTNLLLAEHQINGRPIATFRLQTPLAYNGRSIDLLELPSPKPGSHYPEGYEHVEFVLGQDPRDWYTAYPKLNWDTKGLAKEVNPDVRLKLSGQMSVKFHEYPLDYVIQYLD